MNADQLAGLAGILLIATVPVLSLAGIAASATARERSHRRIYGILGWIGWLLTVAAGVFVGLLAVALSCWGDYGDTSCGDDRSVLVLLAGLLAAGLPGLLAYGLSSRGTPSGPRPPR